MLNDVVLEKEKRVLLEVKTGNGLYLNLFSGAKLLPGFKNIDYYFQDNSVYNYDVQKLPFYNSIVDIIYCSLVNDTATSLFLTNSFKEWGRVLKPNGKLYLKIPDLSRIILELFTPNTSEKKRKLLLFSLYGQESTYYDKNLNYLLNPTLLKQKGFYEEDLRYILKMYGFKEIAVLSYEEQGIPFFWVETTKEG
jgi:SAM-dependent methyltransferase